MQSIAGAAAQQSGLLLGLATDSGFRTLWIASVADKVRLAASGPDLVVPGKTGFWRVCIVDRHRFDGHEFSEGVEQFLETLARQPIAMRDLLTRTQVANLRRRSLAAAKKEYSDLGVFTQEFDENLRMNRLKDLQEWGIERGSGRSLQ